MAGKAAAVEQAEQQRPAEPQRPGDAAAGKNSPGIGAAAPNAAAPPADWQALSVSNLPAATSLLTETE
jgi:hypothetical protein